MQEQLTITQYPEKSRLEIIEGFTINFPRDQPNIWWRFWQWALLGWKWKQL